MIRLGTVLVFFGLGSALLHLTSVQFRLLMWAEPMQPTVGLVLGAVGVVLIVLKVALSKNSEEQAGGLQAGFPPPAGPPQYGQAPQFGQPAFGQAPQTDQSQQFGQPGFGQASQTGQSQQFGQPAPPPGQPAPSAFPPPAQYGPASGPQFAPPGQPAPPQPVGGPPAPPQQQFGPQGFQQPNPFERPGG